MWRRSEPLLGKPIFGGKKLVLVTVTVKLGYNGNGYNEQKFCRIFEFQMTSPS